VGQNPTSLAHQLRHRGSCRLRQRIPTNVIPAKAGIHASFGAKNICGASKSRRFLHASHVRMPVVGGRLLGHDGPGTDSCIAARSAYGRHEGTNAAEVDPDKSTRSAVFYAAGSLRSVDTRLSSKTYFEAELSSLFTVLNVVCKLSRTFFRTAMMPTPMMAAIRPYSMAVAPDSSSTKREKFVIGPLPGYADVTLPNLVR
jgi:hypothetical protein